MAVLLPIYIEQVSIAGWETSARPLANAGENLVGRVENRPGQVEFCVGYIRHCPVRASAKKFEFPSLDCEENLC